MEALFGRDEVWVNCSGLYRNHGCKGLQPSRSRTTIEALITTWSASGPLGGEIRDESFLCGRLGDPALPSEPFQIVKTAQECLTSLQKHDLPHRFLEGARSLGAALGEGSIVWSGRGMGQLFWSLSEPRLQGTGALQVEDDY